MAGDYNIGTAHGVIEIDASSLGRTSAALGYVGNRMLAMGAAAVAGFGFAVKSAADFETQVSRFGAISDASEKQMEKLRQKAMQLGRDSAFGAKEVVEGFVELAKAGFTVQEVLAGVGDAAVTLAAAGEITMAQATDTLAIAIRSFKLEAKDATKVADLLAGVANASLSSVEDLTVSFKYAAPIAATLGISIDDLVVALGLFSQVGIKGSTAGTSLRQVFASLSSPTGPAIKAMRELGIITEDGANIMFDSTGKAKGLGDMFQILKEKTADLTKQERLGYLSKIFQRRALALVAEAAIQGKDGFEALRKEASKTTAQEVMKEKLDNLNGSLRILKASLETLAITIGEPMQEPIKKFADGLREVTNWLQKLDPRLLTAGAYALFAFGAFLLFGGILFKTMQYTIQAYKAFKDLAAALLIVRNALIQTQIAGAPVLGIVALIVLALLILIGTAVIVYKKWDQIWTWMKEHPALAAIIGILVAFLFPIVAIGFAIGALAKNWRAVWAAMKRVVEVFWDKFFEAAEAVIRWFKGPFLEFFKDTLPAFFGRLPGILGRAMSSVAKKVVGAFISFFDDLPYKVGVVLGFVVGTIVKWGVELPIHFINAVAGVIPVLADWGVELVLFFLQLGLDIIGKMLEWTTYILANLPGWLKKIFDKFIEWGLDLVRAMIDIGINIISKAAEWAVRLGPRLFEFLLKLPGQLFELGLSMLAGFLRGLNEATGGVVQWALDLPSKFFEALGNLAESWFNAGKRIMEGLWNGLRAIAASVISWVSNFVERMVHKITHPWEILSPSKRAFGIGVNIMRGLQLGLAYQGAKVLSDLDKFSMAMDSPFSNAGGMYSASGTGGSGMILNASININGVSDPAMARAAGAAAGNGLVDALDRRSLLAEVRMA